MPLDVLVETNDILDNWRIEVYLQLLHADGNLVLVRVLLLIIAVTH